MTDKDLCANISTMSAENLRSVTWKVSTETVGNFVMGQFKPFEIAYYFEGLHFSDDITGLWTYYDGGLVYSCEILLSVYNKNRYTMNMEII